MGANKKYKNNLFVWLFNNIDSLRELYGAIKGVPVDPSIPITINTLDGVFFMKLKNDISFMLGDKLVILIEHQSTVNPNMPVRMLMYIAQIYEAFLDGQNKFGPTLLPLPQPEFIVLYNGEAPYPDEVTLKLSDAFIAAGLIAPETLSLELTVKVYNINQGRNAAIAQKCARLKGYSAFIAKSREYINAGHSLDEALEMTVLYCISHDILKEILEAHASEVIDMVFAEWDEEIALAFQRKEGREEGWQEAWQEKAREDARNLLALGVSPETVAKGTSLDLETVKALAK